MRTAVWPGRLRSLKDRQAKRGACQLFGCIPISPGFDSPHTEYQEDRARTRMFALTRKGLS